MRWTYDRRLLHWNNLGKEHKKHMDCWHGFGQTQISHNARNQQGRCTSSSCTTVSKGPPKRIVITHRGNQSITNNSLGQHTPANCSNIDTEMGGSNQHHHPCDPWTNKGGEHKTHPNPHQENSPKELTNYVPTNHNWKIIVLPAPTPPLHHTRWWGCNTRTW